MRGGAVGQTARERAYSYAHIPPAALARWGAGAACAGGRKATGVTGPRRYFYRQRLAFFDPTLAVTLGARVGNDLAITVTARTGLLNGKETLLHAYLALTAAGRTGLRFAALFGTAAFARIATGKRRHFDRNRIAEHRLLDPETGRVLTPSLDASRMPTIADVPEIVCEFVDRPDEHLTNLGSKGLGEPPIVPIAAAIANAIRDATGADVP